MMFLFYAQVMKLYDTIHELIGKKAVVSAYAVGFGRCRCGSEQDGLWK